MDAQLDEKPVDDNPFADIDFDDMELDDIELDDDSTDAKALDDTVLGDKAPEDAVLENTLAESVAELAPPSKAVSEDEFVEVVGGALEAVGGTLLFKMCVQNEGEGQHVAAASIGEADKRQFLLLTLPTGGGALKVETASNSRNPVASIAEAYAGLMDVFKAAA